MKILSKLLLVIFLSVMIVFAQGCTRIHGESATKTTPVKNTIKKSKIGISMAGQMEDRWILDLNYMKNECKKLGIEVLDLSADLNADKQTSQCEDLISKGIDVLIIVPHDAHKASEIVEIANAQGVKVICYDRMIYDSKVDMYISFDSKKVGELQADALIKAVPKGNYIILSGSPSDNNSKLLLDGAMVKLKPLIDNGDVKVVLQSPIKNWDPNIAYELIKDALDTKESNIQAILAPNDGTASGCIKALAEKKLDGKVFVTGQDGDKNAAKKVMEGKQLMTVLKDTRLLAKEAVNVANMYCKSKPVKKNSTVNNQMIDVPAILLEPQGVYKDNLNKLLVESGYIDKNFIMAD